MSIKKPLDILIILISLVNILCGTKARYLSSNLDISKTSKKFTTFSIDFRGIDTPPYTYWCLLQWNMDLTKFKESHQNVSGGLAYGGLQTTDTDPHGIMSFWQVEYKENNQSKVVKSTRIYPKGQEGKFDNEGVGTNYISTYKWVANVWIRYTVHCWEDYSTGTTFVGQWYQNLQTKEWTLYAYFDTRLKGSYITGPLFQFQENYDPASFGLERSSQFKNMYVVEKGSGKWVSLNKTLLYINKGANKGDTAGTAEYGYTSNYFFMSSGLKVDDQKKYDEGKTSITATITQPETPPDLTVPSFKSVSVILSTTKMTINWSLDSKTSPCYQYIINIFHSSTFLKSEKITRPEVRAYSYTSVFKGEYQIQLFCNAISGFSTSKTINKTI